MKPLYRALLPRDLVLGLPRGFIMFASAITIVLAGSMSKLWPVLVMIVICYIFRLLTKRDEYLVEISFAMILEPNRLVV